MRSIYPSILEQIHQGSGCVLATVVRTSGSTPQKPGSSALFGEVGLLTGTVGGGLLEGEVQRLAAAILINKSSDLAYFNLDSNQGEEGAICGGEAYVLVDANPAKHMQAMSAMEKSLNQRKRGFLLTVVSKKLESGRAISRFWIEGDAYEDLAPELDSSVKEAIPEHLKKAVRYGFTEVAIKSNADGPTEMAYLEHMKPMPSLLIAGAGHVGRALAHLGALLEFEVTVVDDREEFANPVNIPDAHHLVVEEVGAAMDGLEKSPDTYIVIVTRGHQHDAEALKPCVGTDAAYIGMIGSSHKVALMKKQFLENHWATPDQWSALYTPIGIAIGSKTVEEIAISIAAQLVEVRSRKTIPHEK